VSVSVGELIQNKYRIVRLIGQGGMGAVYEGQNEGIARRVAIKVLHGDLAAQHGVVERFEREAQAAGKIGNDHILEVLDIGTLADGDRFMVMEYLDGETLEERLNHLGPLTPRELYPLIRQLLTGLNAAHDAGIIHRDLKPDNVFVLREKAGQPDFVKIIDFGISKFTAHGSDLRMTATGAVMGTPYFMSPEQAKGSRDADVRSDLYAVGVIMFRAITGNVPFDAASFNELLFKIVLAETPRASSLVPDLDPTFDGIIHRAMARDPAARYQSVAQLIRALDDWNAERVSGRPDAPALAARTTPSGGTRQPSNWGVGSQATEFAQSRPQVSPTDSRLQTGSGQALPATPVHSPSPYWLALGGGLGLLMFGLAAFWAFRDSTPPASAGAGSVASAPVAAQGPSVAVAPSPSAGEPLGVAGAAASASAALTPAASSTAHESDATNDGAQAAAKAPSEPPNRPKPVRPVAARPPQTVQPVAPRPVVDAPPPPKRDTPRGSGWDY
jgi:eukaryotic-like serine/threonine-protein kinase